MKNTSNNNGPRIVTIDIETAPILASVWKIWDENIGLNQIERDWFILSFSAKWLGDKNVIYFDQRNKKNIEDDRELLKKIWEILDQADIVIGQNIKHFDIPKLNTRFILNGMQPPSSYKVLDTREIAKRKFGFISNKLEYMTDKLNTKYKKLKHSDFSGFELWRQCLLGNKLAWNSMKKYNIHDVLSTEELFLKLYPWDNSINFNLYRDDEEHVCHCGSTEFKRNGYAYTASGKYQRIKCSKCGSESRDKVNLFSKEKRQSLKVKVSN